MECRRQPACLTMVLRKALGSDVALTIKHLAFSYDHRYRAHSYSSFKRNSIFETGTTMNGYFLRIQ